MSVSSTIGQSADILQSVSTPLCQEFELCEEFCASPDPQITWENQYDRAGVGIVLSGRFDYRAAGGSITGVPGTVLFGNFRENFSIHHPDTAGNRRLVVWYSKSFLEGIAAACGIAQPQFHAMALPPGRDAANMFVRLHAALKGLANPEEAASELAARAMMLRKEPSQRPNVSGADRRRILSVVSYIECCYSESCAIDSLARMSGLSRFQFMRQFKLVTGQSANQYVLNTRLRIAARLITGSDAPISQIALDVGFNNISHFNTCFRALFACSPRQMRKGMN